MKEAVDDPDADLVLGAARGDAVACAGLVDRYLGRVHALAWRTLGDANEAEDVAQDTFLRVWEQVSRWRPGGAKFSTWIFRVAYNLCIDRIRQRRPQVDEVLDMLIDPSPTARNLVERGETVAAVRAAFDALPERQRAALGLCHYEGLSNIEAADILGISVDALESLLSRARRSLRASLETTHAEQARDDD